MKKGALLLSIVLLAFAVVCTLLWISRFNSSSARTVSAWLQSTANKSDERSTNEPLTNVTANFNTTRRFLTTAEKRQQKAAKEAQIVAQIRDIAAKTGRTTNEVWGHWESHFYPERVRLRNEAFINAQREQGLAAGGIHEQLWRREGELEILSKQLANGMSLSAITNLLGLPFRAQTRVITNGLSKPFLVPLDQIETPRQNLILVYSPHPERDYHQLTDEWRILTVVLDDKRQLTSWKYQPPSGTW
jgi:hypothetical protein